MENNPNLKVRHDQSYYSRTRSWPSLFDIKYNARILDIGCGTGVLGGYMRAHFNSKVTGLEIIEKNCIIASSVIDEAHCGDIESIDTSVLGCDYDYVIFSDSLEHLLDPVAVLHRVKSLLSIDGRLLISVPNVRNFRVTVPLLCSDNWEYRDEGLLDKTHLRFFTETSICRLLGHCGFHVEKIHVDLPLSSKVGVLNALTVGIFRRHLTSHYFIKSALR